LLVGLGGVAAFAAGAIGSFVLFEWPAPFQSLVLAVMLAILCVLAVRVGLLSLLQPAGTDGNAQSAPFRVIAMDNVAASFWTHRFTAAAAVFALGWALAGVLQAVGLSLEAAQMLAYLAGIVLLGLGLDMIWRSPQATAAEVRQRQRCRGGEMRAAGP
jgi:moderate conductance mechanosensitive channel